MVEGLFSSVLASIDVDLDFPLDRLCRRIGTFVPVAFAGFLLACQLADPLRCYITSESEPESRFLDSYCRTAPSYIINDANNGTAETDQIWAYFRFFPMLLLLQGFVTYLPYIVYYALTHSVIYPVLNEAQDMIKITSFDITPEKEADHLFALELGEDGDANSNATRLRQRKKVIERQESKAVAITADEDIVKNLQASLERRLQVRLNIFVMQRLYGIRGQGIHKKYLWCNVLGRLIIVLIELGFMLPLFWSGFPSSVRCDVTNATVSNVEPDAYKEPLYCTIPTAGYAQVIFLLDLIIIIFLPLVSIVRYTTYMSSGFENDVKEAEVFVDGDRKTHYFDFLDTLLSSKTDDIVLLMALLYANVDKYTTHKILLTFANLTT